MNATERLSAWLKLHPQTISKVVDFDAGIDKLYQFDFTAANTELNPVIVNDATLFSEWVNKKTGRK